MSKKHECYYHVNHSNATVRVRKEKKWQERKNFSVNIIIEFWLLFMRYFSVVSNILVLIKSFNIVMETYKIHLQNGIYSNIAQGKISLTWIQFRIIDTLTH